MWPLSVALQGKGGVLRLLKRAREIQGRYGITPARIDESFARFAAILNEFGCGATFAVPGIVLERNKLPSAAYENQNIEFALHGYHHIDHSRVSLDNHLKELQRGLAVFTQQGLHCSGFRSPYLRWVPDTLRALRKSGFVYDSSQGLAWNVLDGMDSEAYRQVLSFYRAESADEYPSLPRLENGLVRIPYSLPDDEALIDRFQLKGDGDVSKVWLCILEETYRRGELFVLGLHPERIRQCEAPLRDTLQAARGRAPEVWIARLDEIARWWIDRLKTRVEVSVVNGEEYSLEVNGPPGLTLLARSLEMISPAEEWDGTDQLVTGSPVRFRSPRQPFVGISPGSAPELADFLEQQGYIYRRSTNPTEFSIYLDRPGFEYKDERPLLSLLENGELPLIRLNRWPGTAHSALAVSGDIEGYTIWDYSMRFFER